MGSVQSRVVNKQPHFRVVSCNSWIVFMAQLEIDPRNTRNTRKTRKECEARLSQISWHCGCISRASGRLRLLRREVLARIDKLISFEVILLIVELFVSSARCQQ